MLRALVVADEVDERLWAGAVRGCSADLVIGAGDLPYAYLGFLAAALDAPCVSCRATTTRISAGSPGTADCP